MKEVSVAEIEAVFCEAEKTNPFAYLDVKTALVHFAKKEMLYIKGLNMLLKRLNELRETFEKISIVPENYDVLNEDEKKKRLNEYVVLVHGLKGSFANIGADKISKRAKELELAVKSGDINFCRINTPPFLDETDKFKDTLKKALNVNTDKQGNNEISEICSLLKQLSVFISNFDLEGANFVIDKMSSKSYGKKTDDKIRKLKEFASMYLTFEISEILKNGFAEEGYTEK